MMDGVMYVYYCVVFYCLLWTGSGYPQPPTDRPICGSHSGLCDISYSVTPVITDKTENLQSSSPICDCPSGRSCPRGAMDKDRTLDLMMNSNGQIIKTRLSYCEPIKMKLRPCRFEETAVTLRGVGPIILDIVGDVTCTCHGELSLARTWPDGMYSVRQYTCGKRECRVNASDQPVCERSTEYPDGSRMPGDVTITTEYPCSCPKGWQCTDERHLVSGSPSTVTELTCTYPTSWWRRLW